MSARSRTSRRFPSITSRTTYRRRPLGSFGHLAALSFHETKNLISGEGGALLVNAPQLAERAEMTTRHLRKFCELFTPSRQLLTQAIDRLGLSARAHDRILKVSRTIADPDAIIPEHVSEAIQYRTFDRTLWV